MKVFHIISHFDLGGAERIAINIAKSSNKKFEYHIVEVVRSHGYFTDSLFLVYKYYAIADVFILPTLEDNWSLVVPEAMSCGLPVATSIYNGCAPELVKKDINGIVFDPLSQESLINAFDYFHHQDLTQMGKKSKELEIPFNTENCAKRFCQTINNYSK